MKLTRYNEVRHKNRRHTPIGYVRRSVRERGWKCSWLLFWDESIDEIWGARDVEQAQANEDRAKSWAIRAAL